MKKKNSKRYKKIFDENKKKEQLNVEEAVKLVKNNCNSKFNESIDVSLVLNLNKKKEDANLRTLVN